jgi:hypothetical protein
MDGDHTIEQAPDQSGQKTILGFIQNIQKGKQSKKSRVKLVERRKGELEQHSG